MWGKAGWRSMLITVITIAILACGWLPNMWRPLPVYAAVDTFTVSASTDDARQTGESGAWDTTGITIRVNAHIESTSRDHGGILFQSVTINQGATVTSANLSVYVYSTVVDSANFVVYGNDIDDAATFGSGTSIYSRARTEANTPWIEENVGAPMWHNISVTGQVQEIVNRDEWSSENMSFLMIANGDNYWTWRCYSYDNGDYIPKLYVDIAPEPPVASLVDWTNDEAGQSCEFQANWTADTGRSMSHYIFGTNNTGPWVNTTYSFSGTWSNQTRTLNSTTGILVAYQFWGNDTGDLWGTTGKHHVYVWDTTPSFARNSLGQAVYASRANVWYNGSKEAVYVVFLNTTTPTGEYQASAYDVDNYNWTSSVTICDGITKDDHWRPSISVLPDSRLIIFYGYYEYQLYYRISTYYADSESNLTKLIGNWEDQKSIPWYFPAYATPFRWDDTLLTFARTGTAYGNWSYTKWKNETLNLFVDAWDGSRDAWDKTGASPYLTNSTSNNINTNDNDAECGDFGFANVSSQFGNVEVVHSCNLSIDFITGQPDRFKVYLWNGSWQDLGGNPTATGIWEIDVSDILDTTDKIDNAEIYFEKIVPPVSTVQKAWLSPEVEGFTQPETLVYHSPIGMYASYAKSGDNIIVAFVEYNTTTSTKHNNLYVVYSPDKGASWKSVNGTTLSLPVNMASVLEIETETWSITTWDGFLDENNHLVFAVYRHAGKVGEFTQVAQYSAGLGELGTWSLENTTLKDGTGVYALTKYLDSYYSRPAGWGANATTGQIQCFVRYWNETSKFKPVYTDTSFADVGIGQVLIWDSPSGYQIVTEERYLNALSHLPIETSNFETSSGYLYGLNLTANMTCTLNSVQLYQQPFGGGCQWQAALYNSTFHLIANGSIAAAHSVTKWTYLSSFVGDASIIEGNNYWLCFRAETDDPAGIYYRYTASTVINQTFTYPLDWSSDFPSSISPTTYWNRTITLRAYPTFQVVRGIGAEYPMTFSDTGANSSKAGEPCKFYTYVQDADGVDEGQIWWNATGSYLKQDNQSLGLVSECWVNFTLTLPSVNTLGWYIKCNDTYGNWGNTTVQIINLLIDYVFNFTETVVASASSGVWKAKTISYSETITISVQTAFNKAKIIYAQETVTVTSQYSRWASTWFSTTEIIQTTDTFTYLGRETAVFFMETVHPGESGEFWRAKLFNPTETVHINVAATTLRELFVTVIEYFETVKLDATITVVFIAAPEIISVATVGFVIVALSIALCALVFAIKQGKPKYEVEL